jgi:hypothetical protein
MVAMRTAILIEVRLKPGTPNRKRDKDLDAKKRIIAEPLWRIYDATMMQNPYSSCILKHNGW